MDIGCKELLWDIAVASCLLFPRSQLRSLLNSYEFLSWMCKMWVKIVGLKPIYYRKYAENAGGWELCSVWSKNQNRLSEKCHVKEKWKMLPQPFYCVLLHSPCILVPSQMDRKIKFSFKQKYYSCFLHALMILLRSPMGWGEWCFPDTPLFQFPCPAPLLPTTLSTPWATHSKSS